MSLIISEARWIVNKKNISSKSESDDDVFEDQEAYWSRPTSLILDSLAAELRVSRYRFCYLQPVKWALRRGDGTTVEMQRTKSIEVGIHVDTTTGTILKTMKRVRPIMPSNIVGNLLVSTQEP